MLGELAAVESAAGNATRAATLFGASLAIRQDIGAPSAGPDQAGLNGARTRWPSARRPSAPHPRPALRMSAEHALAPAKDGPWPLMTPAKPITER